MSLDKSLEQKAKSSHNTDGPQFLKTILNKFIEFCGTKDALRKTFLVVLTVSSCILVTGLTSQSKRVFEQAQAMAAENNLKEKGVQANKKKNEDLEVEIQRAQTDAGKEVINREQGLVKQGEVPLKLPLATP